MSLGRKGFAGLPDELKVLVFSYLPSDQLLSSVPRVCKEWQRLAEDDHLWRERFLSERDQWNVFGSHRTHLDFNHSQSSNTSTYYDSLSWLLGLEENASETGESSDEDEKQTSSASNTPFSGLQKSRGATRRRRKPQTSSSSQKTKEAKDKALRVMDECLDPPAPFETWRQLYVHTKVINQQSKSAERALDRIAKKSSSSSSFWPMIKRPFQHAFGGKSAPLSVPIFGGGLDTSAKHLLYRMMWSSGSPFQMTRLYPGKAGIGSGVGFKVQGVELNLSSFYRMRDEIVLEALWKERERDREAKKTEREEALRQNTLVEELKKLDEVRRRWIGFFREAAAFVYILDRSNIQDRLTLSLARQEIAALLPSDNHAPLLVLVFCPDSEDRARRLEVDEVDPGMRENPLSEEEIAEQKRLEEADKQSGVPLSISDIALHLQLNELVSPFRSWNIRKVCADTLCGLSDGLDWLTSEISSL